MQLTLSERENLPRWRPGLRGFFEAYDLTWNNQEGCSGWIRHSLNAPRKGEPEASLCIFTSIPGGKKTLTRESVPIEQTRIEREIFYFQIGDSSIFQNGTRGKISSKQERISWEISVQPTQPPSHPLPPILYPLPFPKTKITIPQPFSRMSGRIATAQETWSLQRTPGDQSHLWGTALPTPWIRGSCRGFREDPGAWFEGVCFPTRLRGKLIPATLLSFFYRGKPYRFLAPLSWLRNKGHHEVNRWHFETRGGRIRFVGGLETQIEEVFGILGNDPSSGAPRFWHLTPSAGLHLEVFEKKREWVLVDSLTAPSGASLEVLTDSPDERIRCL